MAEEGKELLRRKLKQLKITLNEKIVNDLVVFFKLKTSLDLFFRVGIGSIDNQMLKDFAASRSNTFINFFKNRIGKNSKPLKTSTRTKSLQNTIFWSSEKRKKNSITNLLIVAILYLEMTYLVL